MPNADPSLSIAERVDAACDRFEAEWKAGRRPRIDDYLAAAPESDRESLRQALAGLVLELQGRGAADTSTSDSSVRSGDKPPIPTAAYIDLAAEMPTSVGRFEIRSVLGSGAFGKVYRAFDPQLGREVALKLPLQESVKTEAERRQFLKEARSAATINHPNVCQIHEVGEHGGRPYIVMALVPGQSLADLLQSRKKPLPEKQSALIVRKIALALAAAHAKGIVHRDLKPANVMFDKERKDIVVMDFGLARGPKVMDARATQSGVIMGTPAYMSPEQARGDSKAVGPAGDIFSLGVILYELLTGTKPFQGTALEVIGQIVHVNPDPPSKRRPGIDPRLEAICQRAMAKDPAARFASMKELAAAIDVVLRAPAAGPAAETAKPEKTRQNAEQPDTGTLGEVFAALSADRKQARTETAAVVEATLARFRTPRWVFVLFGVLLVGGLTALGGIILFAKTKTATVLINVDVDLSDKTLSFFLDSKPVSAEELAKPVELTLGEHELVVKRGKEVVKRILFGVRGGNNPSIEIREVQEPPPPPDDLKSLQGEWEVTAEEYNGGPVKDKEIREMRKIIAFASDRMTIDRTFNDGRRVRIEGTVKLDAGSNPKTWNFTGTHYLGNRVTFRGLYELDGDALRMVYNQANADQPAPARPAGFRTAAKTSTVLMSAKRLKAKSAPPEVGFVPLFNGKDLTGWEADGKPEAWTIKDGAIATVPGVHHRGWLFTEKAFEDFELRLEFALSFQANSGIAIRGTPGDGSGNKLQLEVQVRDDTNHPPKAVTGSIIPTGIDFLDPPTAPKLKPLGEWNEMRITIRGSVLKIEVNGSLAQEIDLAKVDLASLQGDKEWGPKNLKRQRGRIGLQYSGKEVKFRNLRVRELKANAAPSAADPDRAAAEWALSIGADAVKIRVGGEERIIQTAADLPEEVFQFTWVRLSWNKKVTDAGLANFKGCKDLVGLGIGDTAITDSGLAYFKDCKKLEYLELHGARVTDTGLAHFKDCKNLKHLELGFTGLTDTGLAYFKDCKDLKFLAVESTKVTKAAIRDFQRALPNCEIRSE